MFLNRINAEIFTRRVSEYTHILCVFNLIILIARFSKTNCKQFDRCTSVALVIFLEDSYCIAIING